MAASKTHNSVCFYTTHHPMQHILILHSLWLCHRSRVKDCNNVTEIGINKEYVDYKLMLKELMKDFMDASESKWVNPILDIIGANSLRPGGLHMNLNK